MLLLCFKGGWKVLFPGICSSLVAERIESREPWAGNESTQPGGLNQRRLPWRNLSDSVLSSWEGVWFPSFENRGNWLLPLWLPLPSLPQLTPADFLHYLAPSGALLNGGASLFNALIQLIDRKLINFRVGNCTPSSVASPPRCLGVARAHQPLEQGPDHVSQQTSIFDWRTGLHGSLQKPGDGEEIGSSEEKSHPFPLRL